MLLRVSERCAYFMETSGEITWDFIDAALFCAEGTLFYLYLFVFQAFHWIAFHKHELCWQNLHDFCEVDLIYI